MTQRKKDDTIAFMEDGKMGAFDFSEQSIRKSFIRKVYSILMCQLLITLSFITVFVYSESVKLWARGPDGMMLMSVAALAVSVCLITMMCFVNVRRTAPMNFIFLGIFTIAESFLLGITSSRYDPQVVMWAVGLTAAVCLALTLFAFQTKWDLTTMGGIMLCGLVILLLFGIISFFNQDRIMDLVYSSLGALLFSIFLVCDTQLMLGGNHKYAISPEEYIFAAHNLYLDVINLFLYILRIVGDIFWLSLLKKRSNQVMALVWASVTPFPVVFFLAFYITQTVCKNSYSVLPHECIYAVLNIYWDLVEPMVTIFFIFFWSVRNEPLDDTESDRESDTESDTEVPPQQDLADQPPSYSTLFHTTSELPQYKSEPPGCAPSDAMHQPNWDYESPPPAYVCLSMPDDGAQMMPQPAEDVPDTTQEVVEGVFANKSVSNSFLRKVYATLACKMLVTSGFVAIFLYQPSVKFAVKTAATEYPYVWAAPVTPMVLCGITIMFGTSMWRQSPITFLITFTLAKSFLLGFISSFCDTQSIFMAVCLTAVVCLILTLYGSKTCSGLFACFFVVPLLSYSIFWVWLFNGRPDQVTGLVWASVIPFLIALFIAYTLMQTVRYNEKCVSPHEYIFVAINMYWEFIEWIMLIICIIFMSLGLVLLYGLCDCCLDEEKQDDCQPEYAENVRLSVTDNK